MKVKVKWKDLWRRKRKKSVTENQPLVPLLHPPPLTHSARVIEGVVKSV